MPISAFLGENTTDSGMHPLSIEAENVAIGIGHVNQSTYDVLRVRIPEIVKEGYRFIKLSEAVK